MATQQGQGKFAGAGALHANALGQFHPGTASFAGAGKLVSASTQLAAGVGVLAGAGNLVSASTQLAAGVGVLAGAGSLNASTSNLFAAASSFSGAGRLVAPPASLLLAAYGSFAGAGLLNANTSNLFASTATMAGSGNLAASAAFEFTGFASLFGTGLLYADGEIYITPPPPPPVPRPSSGKNIMAVPTLYAIASTSGWTAPSASAPVVHVFGNQPANILVPLSSLPIGPVTLTLTKPDGTTYAANATYSYSAMIFSVAYLIYQADAGELDQVGWWLCSVGGEQCTFFIWPP